MIITAGIYKGQKVIAPNERITRPTLSKTRMGVFNTLYSIMGDFEGKTFLDVFGGSGIMGLEALSRGFKSVKVYELNRKSAEIIKNNYKKLGLEADLTIGDSVKLLKKSNVYYDVVYIDPPYKNKMYGSVLSVINGDIIVVESDEDISLLYNYELIKCKIYGNTKVTYLKKQTL